MRSVFACIRKDRLTTRTGAPYLVLELRDRTGTISARAFRDADVLAGRFERGDLVRVAGRVERFRDELVLEVSSIARVEPGEDDGDPGRFLPSAYRDLDELDGFLGHLSGEVRDRGFRALLDALLGILSSSALRLAPCKPRRASPVARQAARAHICVDDACLQGLPAHPRLNPVLL